MTATGTAPAQISVEGISSGSALDELLAAMLRANPRISDLIFSPGRAPQVQINGAFANCDAAKVTALTADDTRRIASQLIGTNKAAIATLREKGHCDVSYPLPGIARFRVNVFIQRGSCAIVMRVIPTHIPTLKELGAPIELAQIATLRDGLVLIAGPRGCGKSSTLAAVLDHVNASTACHIVTIEDPIEFLHVHKQAVVHQREVHSDTPSVADAMGAALRQAPNIIVVGELKNRETTELALEAAETGHLVLSTITSLTAAKAVERVMTAFSSADQDFARERLSRMLRYVISQRLVPRADGERIPLFEIVKADSELLSSGATKPLPQKSRTSAIDRELERLATEGAITTEVALAHSVDPAGLSQKLGARSKPNLR